MGYTASIGDVRVPDNKQPQAVSCRRKDASQRGDEWGKPLIFYMRETHSYLKSYSTVAFAIISNSSIFVVYQRYRNPVSGLGPDRGITLPPR